MDKSLLLLSAPLLTLLLHADEPIRHCLPEESSLVQPVVTQKNRRLVKVVPQQRHENLIAQEDDEDSYEMASPSEPSMTTSQEDRLKSLECQMQRIEEQLCECCQPFLARPDQSFYIQAEWIYWKFTEGGTEFAFEPVQPDATSDLPDIPGAHVAKIHFKWESGFRLGAGYHFCEKGWDLFARYTQINPHGDGEQSGSVYPLLNFQDNEIQDFVTSANADWKIHYKAFDLELGRQFNVAPSLMFRPFFGLKAAKIDQHFHVSYRNDGPTSLFVTIPTGTANTVHEKNDFRGIGLRAGVGTLWEISECYGLSFYGNAAVSLLVSEIEVEQKQNIWQGAPLSSFQEAVDLKSKFHPLLPVAELAFGLEWAKGLCCDQYRIHIFGGVEGQYWWRQNYLEHFTGVTSPSVQYIRTTEDLGIYGINLGARFDF